MSTHLGNFHQDRLVRVLYIHLMPLVQCHHFLCNPCDPGETFQSVRVSGSGNDGELFQVS